MPADGRADQGGDRAETRGGEPRDRVLAGVVAHDTGEDRGDAGADLMRREHPAEHERTLVAEDLTAKRDGRRYGRDPVEPVDDDEHDDARLHLRREQARQEEQAHPAQRVIRGQEDAWIHAVGEPAGEHGADDVEDAHDREKAGRGGRRHAMVVGARDEMRADQSVGRRSADREADRQRPEGLGARGFSQRREGELRCAPGRAATDGCRGGRE